MSKGEVEVRQIKGLVVIREGQAWSATCLLDVGDSSCMFRVMCVVHEKEYGSTAISQGGT